MEFKFQEQISNKQTYSFNQKIENTEKELIFYYTHVIYGQYQVRQNEK